MKKILALLLVLMTLVFAGAAVAEDYTAVIESAFDGVWVQFEDGFEIYLPSDWLEYEVTDDLLEAGIFYVAASSDGANTVQLAWIGYEAEMTLEDRCAQLATVYADAEIIELLDGMTMIAATDVENDVAFLIAQDGTEPGEYMFLFTPASDEAFMEVAGFIACSIRNIAE